MAAALSRTLSDADCSVRLLPAASALGKRRGRSDSSACGIENSPFDLVSVSISAMLKNRPFATFGVEGKGAKLRIRQGHVASKHAVLGLTKTAAVEYGKYGIRVDPVSPGAVRTEMLLDVFGSKEMLDR